MGARKPVRKTSKKATKKNKKKTAKKKVSITPKKISKATVKITVKKQKTKPSKKIAIKSRARKESGKQKKKTVKKARVTKRPSIPKKRTAKKAEEEKKFALRKTLINKRAEIFRETKQEISKYIKGETRQLIESALDDGDWSVIDLSEDINLRQLSAHRKTLLKIDDALRKIDEGTYGICEECGEPINEARLKVMPFAIYCIDCQENKEQLEKIETANVPI